MVAFCESVLDSIKRASSETEIREIVATSFDGFKQTRTHQDEALYAMNMIVILNASQEETLPAEQKNIQIALGCFRDLRRQNQELIF